MDTLCSVLSACPEYRQLTDLVMTERLPACVVGLSHIHKAHWTAALCKNAGKKVLLITPDDASAVRLSEDIAAFLCDDRVLVYTQKDFCFRSQQTVSREYEHRRLQVLGRLISGDFTVAISSIGAAIQYTLPPDVYAARTLQIDAGGSYSLAELTEAFVRAGYVRRDQVDGTCQFAVRGGILDIFPPDSAFPVRMEFWDDEIDSMAFFDPETQRRTENVVSVKITPAQEALFDSERALSEKIRAFAHKLKGHDGVKEKLLADADRLESGADPESFDKYLPILYDRPATIFDYLPQALTVISEYSAVKEACRREYRQCAEDVSDLMEEQELCPGLDRFCMDFPDFITVLESRGCVMMETFAKSISELALKELINVNAVTLSPWSGEEKILLEDLRDLLLRGFCVAVAGGSDKTAHLLVSDLRAAGIPCEFAKEVRSLIVGRVFVIPGGFSGGFEYPSGKFAMLTHAISGLSRQSGVRRAKSRDARAVLSLSDLVPGDYVVHSTHGIGIFEGIHQIDMHGIVKDYLKIRYAGTDVLYVAVTQLDQVSKYIGPGSDKSVKINSLSSAQWQQTKARVRRAVKDMAKELIALYARRMHSKGYAFSPDNDWQADFEERFPYRETDDQLRCIDEIKHDMMRPVPMDRLLCGDVGFGKTEVALRAAFKCVLDSKQCAILVPTTILAWQHYQTLLKRMDGFPVHIELLSRFRTPKQQQAILKKLRSGEIDIIVGTHRLVQDDVKFKDLGLVIIDEEQRFGVAHKEKLKNLKENVDVLTLSATPIPRTLNLAMSGIRDMSAIEQAPNDRYPVQTYVTEHDRGVLLDAIRRELRRGGQVFYLHNHIESIDRCAAALQRDLPEARICFAHGKMSEEELSEIWRKLIDREIDILVCTTIIETGVDVPNCNTLIIEDADRMGLSQLYQLRGRVGRSNRRAFAYLTYRPEKALSEIATKRLSAIREFTQFGSGFHIAMRDLEIRGAGSILGGQQHGHMESVGYEMYVKLLNEAIAEERGDAPSKAADDCFVDLPINAHIPESYIHDLKSRIEIYRRIADIRDQSDASDVLDELIDRFGDPPVAVEGLITVAQLRNMAMRQGFTEISQKDGQIRFYPKELDMRRAARLVQEIHGRAVVNAGEKPYIGVRLLKGDDPLFIMKESLNIMNDLPENP